MNLKSTLLTCAIALFAGTLTASAVPAYPYPIKYTQSDGTQITIRIVGDEYSHYTLSSEGYSLAGGVDGDYYYAEMATDGTLVATSVKAKPLGALTPTERAKVTRIPKGLKPTAVTNAMRRPDFVPSPQTRADGNPTPPERISNAPTIGKIKSLIILMELKDTPFSKTSNPKQSFTDLLTQEGYSQNGAAGSARDFYHDNSKGLFDPEFVVVGPYKSVENSDYYAGSSGSDKVHYLIAEAARAANAEIDFTEFADNGYIRDVFVFFSGTNQAEGGGKSRIWPHRWDVRYGGQNVTLDGQKLAGYACTSEINAWGSFAGIGTFCHEFGHVLGWQDFYDTDDGGSGGDAPGLENYSLMCSGSYNNKGRTPPALNILERWMVGWAEPKNIETSGHYTLDPIWENDGFLIKTPTTNDYFLIENRPKGSRFKWGNILDQNQGAPASYQGMLVYHVDYTSKWSNRVNANPAHECMKLVRSAPGVSGVGTTFFPGKSNVTSLSSATNIHYKSWKKEDPIGTLSELSIDGEQIRVRISAGKFGLIPEINQNDIYLSWSQNTWTTWQIAWRTKGGQESGNKRITGNSLHITGLTPDTDYEIDVIPVGFESEKQSLEVRTKPRDKTKSARIKLPETISSVSPIILSILDTDGAISAWYVDGRKLNTTTPLLYGGVHKITAVITETDGSEHYLIKFITIK